MAIINIQVHGFVLCWIPPTLDHQYHDKITPLQLQVWKVHFGVCPQASHDMWLLIFSQYSQC